MFVASMAMAENRDSGVSRNYRNPEERREAGIGTHVTDWLRLAGLLELEKERSVDQGFKGLQITNSTPTVPILQIAAELTFSEVLGAEIVYEAEHDRLGTHTLVEEAFIKGEFADFGFEAGRLSLPFGEYYSHFITGPMLEFGETRSDALSLDYSPTETLEITAFVFESRADRLAANDSTDWGIAFELTNNSESLRAGFSYLSDLAESDEQFLVDENNRFVHQVGAWSAYALIGFAHLEVTAEFVRSIGSFDELDAGANKPSASNIELAYFPKDSWQVALRYERSDGFGDAPERQYGIAWSWRPVVAANLSLEYLQARYKPGFVQDDNENELNRRRLIAARIGIEF